MINDANIIPIGRVPTYTRAIKIGNRVFPLAVYSNTSGGMDFYKCAAVYGPRNVTRIRVEGAGTTAVNGDYEKTDITNDSGGEVWKHLTTDYYYYQNYDRWCIDANYNTYGESALYYSWDGGANWSTGYNYDTGGPTGAEPVPTTSKIQVTLDADVPKTWDGYKAESVDGVYSISEELTQGLSWTLIRPEVKSIYSADALIKVSSMHGIDSSMIFHARLASLTDTADTWQKLTYIGSPQVSTVDGIACLRFSSGQGIQTSEKIGISGKAPRTISIWALPENDVPDYPTAVFWGNDNANGSTRVLFGPKKNGDNMRLMFGGWNNDADFSSNIPVGNKLHHCALVYNGEKMLLYIDGQSSSNNSVSGLNTTDSKLSIGYASVVSGYSFIGYIADVKVYDRALEEAEILELFQNPPSGDTPEVDDPDSYAIVNGEKYTKTTRGENTADNYPVYFMPPLSTVEGKGDVLEFNTSAKKWQLRSLSTNNIIEQAKTSGIAGLTGEWENGSVVIFTGTLPDWVGESSGDKEYELTVSDATGDHAGANAASNQL